MKAQDLKNSILQMAMEGKLVPQDPNDEPASVLLEKIKAEKEQLIKEKKIKRNNKESIIVRKNNQFFEKIGKNGEEVCIDDEIPFDIPESWEWVRFGSVVNFSMGKTPQRKNPEFWDNSTIPWVSIADMVDGGLIYNTKEKVNDYAINKSFKGKIVPKETLLMSFKLTVGKVSILKINAVHNEAIISINPFIDLDNSFRNYLFYILPLVSQTGDTKTAIKGKTLNSKSLNNLLLPLPSLNEQRRIVNKIKKLLPFIENYGQIEEELDELNTNFPDLIKKSILQEAIQGKLVPQNPNDEPVSILLERIRIEKEQLIKDKKIKRNKNESLIYRENNHFYEKIDKKEPICIDDEIPFDIPNSWEWVRFGSVVNFSMGKTPQRKNPEFWDNSTIPWVSIADMVDGGLIYNTKERVNDYAIKKSFKGKIVPKETLLMSFKLTVGKVSILKINAVHNEAIISINPLIDLDNSIRDYLFYILPLVSQTGDTKTAIKGKTLNSKSLNNLLLPLPSLNEQRRIVNKINYLMDVI